MDKHELAERTMNFAIRVLKMTDSLPKTAAGRAIGGQVARSATSVAAKYRAALRGKSRADFINKITIVLEEADETEFWIELAERAGLIDPTRLTELRIEANELIRIFSATRRTATNHKS